MKLPVIYLSALLPLMSCGVHAQGTLVYDQESSNDEGSPFSGAILQFYGTVGQSFTPSLNGVGFVRFRYFDINPGNSLGATLSVNLRANAINGPIVGTATPVTLSDGFVGGVNFFFPSTIPVTPNATYFLETFVQSGDNWGTAVIGDTYPNGIIYGGLQPFSGQDLWFREGIIVPEPSSALLLVMGCGAAGWFMRRKRRQLS